LLLVCAVRVQSSMQARREKECRGLIIEGPATFGVGPVVAQKYKVHRNAPY